MGGIAADPRSTRMKVWALTGERVGGILAALGSVGGHLVEGNGEGGGGGGGVLRPFDFEVVAVKWWGLRNKRLVFGRVMDTLF